MRVGTTAQTTSDCRTHTRIVSERPVLTTAQWQYACAVYKVLSHACVTLEIDCDTIL